MRSVFASSIHSSMQVSKETFIKIWAQGIFSGKLFEGAVWFSVSIDLCATWKPIKLSSVQQLLATLVVLSSRVIHKFHFQGPPLMWFLPTKFSLTQLGNQSNYHQFNSCWVPSSFWAKGPFNNFLAFPLTRCVYRPDICRIVLARLH